MKKLFINQWQIHLDSGDIRCSEVAGENSGDTLRLEPKGLQLLIFMANNPGVVFAKEQLFSLLWPEQVVTDDALTRCISRLRKVLNDDPKAPKIIETIPRRGYRFVAQKVEWQVDSPESRITSTSPVIHQNNRIKSKWGKGVSLVVFIFSLVILWLFFSEDFNPLSDENMAVTEPDIQAILRQADDYYLQIRRKDNEMAIELYQQAMALRPDSGAGQAGLANALVQQVLRWPNPATEPDLETQNLQQAIEQGRTNSVEAQQKLARALALAKGAVEQSPESPRAHKALGFVLSAMQEFDAALVSYQRAIELQPLAWDALINAGDVSEIKGDLESAVDYYQLAYDAMHTLQAEQSARVNPWLADLGALIAERYLLLNKVQLAEVWYRKVLHFAPFNASATKGLASILAESGDTPAAQRLCMQYQQRIGTAICDYD